MTRLTLTIPVMSLVLVCNCSLFEKKSEDLQTPVAVLLVLATSSRNATTNITNNSGASHTFALHVGGNNCASSATASMGTVAASNKGVRDSHGSFLDRLRRQGRHRLQHGRHRKDRYNV